ncbi:hypothetical protein [Aquimarina brevivitae]|uniref:Cytochrome c domain-containing protein n=1 Tax=Aquimarina brevivitae TaxID=323412 RepID=A0A4V2F5P0_9FLAO|nr:hypothetical protein [Aquimarina brevivitae]RZS93489.1 hypothetical protein EV197_2068 [Aquimarina brevivitae]
MKSPIYVLLFFAILFLVSCGSDEEAVTEPPIEIDPDPIPGKTTTYVADVKAIIDANCIECHSNPPTQSAPMSLVTYEDVKDAEVNGELYPRMFTSSFTRVMPPPEEGGRLPDATIKIIEDWIADGLLEQ